MQEPFDLIRPHVARLCELSDRSAADTGALDGIDQTCLAIERVCKARCIASDYAGSIRHCLARLRHLDDAGTHMIYASCVGEKIAQLRDYLELQATAVTRKADRRPA